MKTTFYTVFILWISSTNLFAQEVPPETVLESAAEGVSLSEIHEHLQKYIMQPLNLNEATYDELIIPGLFSATQAEALTRHRLRYGDLLCFEELQSMNEFDINFLNHVKPYFKVDTKPELHRWDPVSIIHQSKQSLLLRTHQSFSNHSGYTPRYEGDDLKVNFSWRMLAGNYFDLGFSGEKDAGEPWLQPHRPPVFDFNAFHLYVKPYGHIRSFIVGDYQVNCGQGLVCWSGFSYGKGPEVISIRKTAAVIKPYSSFSESGFLKGAAVSMSAGKYAVTAWISRRKLDSYLKYSTAFNEDVFQSVRTDGYHRTAAETESARNLRQSLAGVNIRHTTGNFQQELTLQGVRYALNKVKGDSPYQYFDTEGKKLVNVSYAYATTIRNINAFGEVAIDAQKHIASLHGIIINTDSRIALSFLHRSLPPGYSSLNANPFRENSQAANEHGFFAGISWQYSREWKLQAYVDFFSFPWLRYEVSSLTKGSEWLSQLTYIPVRNAELYIRVRQQTKPGDISGTYTGLKQQEITSRYNIRFNTLIKLTRNFSFQTRAEVVMVDKSNAVRSSGWLMFEEIDLKPMGKPWAITLRYALFGAPDYDTRIYAYVQDIPGSFSIPSFYENGDNWYILLRYRVMRGLDCWIRWSVLSRIGGNSPNKNPEKNQDLGLQLRYNF